MVPNPSETKWHVLQVKPKSEKKVGQRLLELGFESCVPTQKQLRNWSDRKKLVEVVLFNNYVFVATDQKRKSEVFFAGNIYGYLHFGGKAALLTDKEVEMIKHFGHISEPVSICYNGLSKYDEVEIISGSLAGFRGIVTAVNGASRLQLALPSLHCFANVELKQTEIRRITAH